MPAGIEDGGVLDERGRPIGGRITRMVITVPGVQKTTFEDEDGIEFRGRDEWGRPIVGARRAEVVVLRSYE